MVFGSVDLLSEIEKIQSDTRVLFTTFRYNQQFFENHVFSHFKNRAFPLVLVDYSEYSRTVRQRIKSKFAEIKYFIEPIKLKGVFHPKLVIATSKDALNLIIGSANITPPGYLTNGEVVSSLRISYNKDNPENVMLDEIKHFLVELKELVGSTPHKKEIEKIISRIRCVDTSNPQKCWFLHNLQESILSQVNDIIDNDNVREVIIASRYFAPNIEFYNQFISDFSDKLMFIIQRRNNDLPVPKFKKWNNLKHCRFRSITFTQKERSLHAKIIIFKTETNSYCLSGSANFTKSGLYSSADNGNIEVSLLRKEDQTNYFDYLFKTKDFTLNSISLESVESVDFPFEDSFESPDFYITEARLVNSCLKINIDRIITEKCSIIS